MTDGKKVACQTFIAQTQLLVTLASAFLLAPAGLLAFVKDNSLNGLSNYDLNVVLVMEFLFLISVVAGYVALGAVAGSQDSGEFDVFRPATRYSSLTQFGAYLIGMTTFGLLARRVLELAAHFPAH